MIRPAVRHALVPLARRWPTGLYRSLGYAARATEPLTRRRDTTRRIGELFPLLTPAEAQRAAAELHSAGLKSRALGIALSRTRDEPVFPAVRVDAAFAAIRGPAILATLHVGAVGALGGALARVPGEILTLHRMDWALPRNVDGVYVPDTEAGSAAGLYRAVQTIRRGGCVVVHVDGSGHDVSVLGRPMTLKRGAFALARLTHAPLVPVFARWDGPGVEVVCGEPIAAAGDEPAMARAMATAIERHLLAHPAAIGDQLLRHLTRT